MKRIASILSVFAAVALFAADEAKPAAKVDAVDLVETDDTAVESSERPAVTATADSEFIDIACDNATISSILRQFRRATKMNIISGESTNLSKRVSVSLNHVRWGVALRSVLALANFKLEERDSVWYVSEKTKAETLNATRHYVLKHASAQDLADIFNGLTLDTTYNERNAIQSSDKDDSVKEKKVGNQKEDKQSAIAGLAKATAVPDSNILILTGTDENLAMCDKIIEQLDRPITQVYIEARFIQLSNEAKHKLGMQWEQLESWGASVKSLKAGYQHSNGKVADYGTVIDQRTVNNNNNMNENHTESVDGDGKKTSNDTRNSTDNSTDNTTLKGIVPDGIGDALGAGASSDTMGWKSASTFAGQLSADDFRLALSAFEKIEDWKMFSNPRIIVANGKEAKVDMTEKEPYIEVTSDRSGTEGQYLTVSTQLKEIPGRDKNFSGEVFFSYGISLKVKPRVSPTGLISVEVVPSISELVRHTGANRDDAGNIISTDTPSTSYPVIRMRSINTEFTMKDGATAVIGGLTETKEEDVDSGIPYLRQIPWIGQKLFGWQSRQKVQSEILVCVTVGIANPETLQKDAGLPMNAVIGREYVEGRLLEPGERKNGLKHVRSIDTRTIDEIQADPYKSDDDDGVDLTDDENNPIPAEKPAKAGN